MQFFAAGANPTKHCPILEAIFIKNFFGGVWHVKRSLEVNKKLSVNAAILFKTILFACYPILTITMQIVKTTVSGLPDFSLYKIPKQGKQNTPIYHKIQNICNKGP
jgi:hypothetical protein